MAECNIPVSAHFTLYADGTRTSNFVYHSVDAQVLAAFLVRGFGIDVDDLTATHKAETNTIIHKQ